MPPQATEGPPTAGATRRAPNALIWVSGLGETAVDQSVLTVAHRVALALDHQAGEGGATFPVGPGVQTQVVGPGDKQHTEVCTISRKDPGGDPQPIIDVYRLDVQAPLTKSFVEARGLKRAGLTLHALWICRKRALTKGRTVAKTKKERRQAAFSQFYVALFFVYLLFLLASAVATLLPPDNAVVRYITHGPALVMTAVAVWKARVLPAVVSGTASMTSAVRYLEGVDGRGELRGRFTSLLEHMWEPQRSGYDDVKVIAYSFGSIVAIDALFPSGKAAEPRYAHVSALATIGCPFDYVRTYWPTYFKKRFVTDKAPAGWVNVCRIGDVFGSNFRIDAAAGAAQATVETVAGQPAPPKPENRFYPPGDEGGEPGFVDTIALVGLQHHAMYWAGPLDATEDAFALVAGELYGDTAVLA